MNNVNVADMLTVESKELNQTFDITPGIYFGLPEKVYHAIPALSASGMKNLLVSAPDFYFNSWLNPFKDEDSEDEDAKEWQKFGRASHTRILEGKETFDSLYCLEFVAPEGCLDTIGDIRKFLKECESHPEKGFSSWSKDEWVKYVLNAFPDVKIYDVEKEKYWKAQGRKIQISAKDLRRIEIAAAMIEKHPALKYYFKGGYAEVSVVWIEDGLWFKARFDYLKPAGIVDLKTFTNMQNKPIDLALYTAMAGLKYHIQACHYLVAGKKAIEFARTGAYTTFSVQRHGPTPEFIKLLGEQTGHEFNFCFQKKGGAPLARGKRFDNNLSMLKCAEASIAMAKEKYKEYYARFGTDIWVDDSGISPFEDQLFPTWATDL